MALAVVRPTITPPIRPGPAAAAMPSMSRKVLPASIIALATMRSSASTWARAAISGTTPPNGACSLICDSTMLDRILPGPSPERSTTAAAVSSHVVSIPSTSIMPYYHAPTTIERPCGAILRHDLAAWHARQPAGACPGAHGACDAGGGAWARSRADRNRGDPNQRRPHPGPAAGRGWRQGTVHQGDRG